MKCNNMLRKSAKAFHSATFQSALIERAIPVYVSCTLAGCQVRLIPLSE